MKKHAFATTTTLLALLALTGCGRSLTGAYSSTISLSTLSPGCTTNSVATNIVINANASTVTGSWSSSCMNATFTGTDNGQGTITNVIATVTPVNAQAYGNTGGYYGQSTNCIYNGSLSRVNNNLLNGTLTLQQNSAYGAYGYGGYGTTSNAQCSTSLSINGTQTN